MAILAILLSAAVAGMGVVGIVSPARLLEIVGKFQTPRGIYAATAIRLVLGVALFLAAPGSRAPALLEILGIVIMVAGLITPVFGLERFRRILDWWSAQGSGFIRAWALCAVAFGAYLVYALAV
jgi:hypothetical protein